MVPGYAPVSSRDIYTHLAMSRNENLTHFLFHSYTKSLYRQFARSVPPLTDDGNDSASAGKGSISMLVGDPLPGLRSHE